MTEYFSLYLPRESGFHNLNPLTKCTLAGLFLVLGLILPGIWTAPFVFALVLLPVALWAKVLSIFSARVARVVLPFAVSLFLIQGLFWQGGTPLLDLYILSFKKEGLLFAAETTGRILIIVSSFILLSLTTKPDALMITLSQRGLPGSLTYVILSTIQIVPRFQSKASMILDAQRSRGLETEGNISKRVKALLPLVVPLVLGSLVEIENRAIALEARAFNQKGPKTSLMVVEDSSFQVAVRLFVGVFVVSLILVRLLTRY